MIDLTGKVALITGSSRGIGRGCAIEMAKVGANVVVNYRTHKDEAEEVAGTIEELGKAAAFLASDAAEYITGECLRVDGGFWLGRW